jgi:hypothetical protein
MPLVVDHFERFVRAEPDSFLFVTTGEALRPSNFWVMGDQARKTVDLGRQLRLRCALIRFELVIDFSSARSARP